MKHLLLAVSGMTPQIITETLYGIYQKNPAEVPSEIHVITTLTGSDRLYSALMGKDNKLEQFCRDYQLPPISFGEQNIHIPIGDDGEKIRDVRGEREQEIIADFITQFVRQLTSDPNISIHASLAGGRKTMGFAMGYAMSLFGRSHDKLSHVLVSAAYESKPDFYYPPPLSPDKDCITLANIPLVFMREEMPTALLNNDQLTYTETVARINVANKLDKDTARISLDFSRLSVTCNDYEVQLKPDNFAFYSWFASDSKENPGEGINAPHKEMKNKELIDRMRVFHLAIFHESESQPFSSLNLEELAEEIKDHLSRLEPKPLNRWLLQESESTQYMLSASKETDRAELFKKHKTLWDRLLRETNKALEDVLGKKLSSFYKIKTVGREDTEVKTAKLDYKGLDMLPDNICFKN